MRTVKEHLLHEETVFIAPQSEVTWALAVFEIKPNLNKPHRNNKIFTTNKLKITQPATGTLVILIAAKCALWLLYYGRRKC
jgi:hypothetical protein